MLVPCPGCSRHVRVDALSPVSQTAQVAQVAHACPFCGFAGAWPRGVPLRAGMARFGSRAALVFGALELGALGCVGPAEVPPLPSPTTSTPSTAPAPEPSASDAGAAPIEPAAPDAGGTFRETDASLPRAPVAIYGAPPPPRPKK